MFCSWHIKFYSITIWQMRTCCRQCVLSKFLFQCPAALPLWGLPSLPAVPVPWAGLVWVTPDPCCVVFWNPRGHKFHRQEIPTIVWDKESFTQPQFFLSQCNISIKTPVSEKISFWINSINSFWYRTWIYLGFGLWIKIPVVPVPSASQGITHPKKQGAGTLSSHWDHSPTIPNLVGSNLCPVSAVRARTWWIFILSPIGLCPFYNTWKDGGKKGFPRG